MKSFTFILFITFSFITVSIAVAPSTLSYDSFHNGDIAAEPIPNGETDLVSLASEKDELKAIDFELEDETANHQTNFMSETSNQQVNPTINIKIPVANRPLITKKVTVADMADFNQAKTLEKWLESKTAAIMQEKASAPTETSEMEPEMSEEPTLSVTSRLSSIESKIRNLIQHLTNRNIRDAKTWLADQDKWLSEEGLEPIPTSIENIEDMLEPSAEAELATTEINTSSRQIDESEEDKRGIISWLDSEPAEEVPQIIPSGLSETEIQEPEPSAEMEVLPITSIRLPTSSKQIDESEEDKRGIISWLDSEPAEEVPQDEPEPSAEMELELAPVNRLELVKESINKHEQIIKLLQNRVNRDESKIPTIVRDGKYDDIAKWLDSQETEDEEEPEMSAEPTTAQVIPNTVRDGVYDTIANWVDSQDVVVDEEEPEMSAEPTN